MRLSRTRKLFIKLSVVVIIFTVAIYCLQSSSNAITDVSTYFFYAQNASQKLDDVAPLNVSASRFHEQISNNHDTYKKTKVKQMLNVWSIFHKSHK